MGEFHFTSTEGRYFTIHEVNYFTFGNAEYFTRKTPQLVADDIQGLRLDLFTKLWYNNFNNIKFDKGVQLYEIHFC